MLCYLPFSVSDGGPNYKLFTDALQSSSSFPSCYRHNAAHHYLEEGHPFTIDPNSFDIGSSTDLSDEMRIRRLDGSNLRKVHASIETHVSRDYMYQFDSNSQIEGTEDNNIPQPQRHAIIRRKRSRLAPHLLSSSILPTRRNSRTPELSFHSDLLTFEEEKEIAGDIQSFRSVNRARDNLVEWMTRDIVHRVEGTRGNHHYGEPSDHQLAASCSLTVDQLRDVIARGQDARTKLIRGNVGLVTVISKRYYNMLRNNGGMGRSTGAQASAGGTDATLKLDDLIQEGYLGIMEAAERFDPEKGFRFSTYATHWIRQRIVRSIAESSRTIRLPIHVQTIIRNMHKKRKELEATTGRRPSTPELAHELGVPLDKIHLYQHLSKQVLSLEHPLVGRSNTENKRTLGDRVACTEAVTPDEFSMSEDLRGEVHAMLDGLRHDERLVLTHRFGLDDGRPKSLRETAEILGVSSDIVRTVEAKALNKLRQPKISYRLKDYVGGPEGGLGGDLEVADHGFLLNNFANIDEQQQKSSNHYQFQTGTSRLNNMDNIGDDELYEYERPTPESIWSF